MKIFPMFDNVLITPQDYNDYTSNGIILPTIEEAEIAFGKIVAVGDCRHIKVNDIVVLDKSECKLIVLGNKTYYIVSENKLLGVIDVNKEN